MKRVSIFSENIIFLILSQKEDGCSLYFHLKIFFFVMVALLYILERCNTHISCLCLQNILIVTVLCTVLLHQYLSMAHFKVYSPFIKTLPSSVNAVNVMGELDLESSGFSD